MNLTGTRASGGNAFRSSVPSFVGRSAAVFVLIQINLIYRGFIIRRLAAANHQHIHVRRSASPARIVWHHVS